MINIQSEGRFGVHVDEGQCVRETCSGQRAIVKLGHARQLFLCHIYGHFWEI